jgi:hypothetical protein
MIDSISYPGLLGALLLPWLLGCIWTRWLLLKSGRWNWFILLGFGYFLGIFFTTVLMRLSDAVGAGLNFSGLATAMALLIVAGVSVQLKQVVPQQAAQAKVAIRPWQTVLLAILLALLAWRYLTILQELLLRPLYAWDAWMNWAPKAIVWFHLGELVDYVKPEQWLAQAPDANQYTLGNRQASEYPPTVPLILLWSMMGAQNWDHSALFLPWFLAAINLGFALYGQLRLNGCQVLPAALACYLLLNLPYYNVHTVLAGYADIWLAAAFGLSIFALREWHLNRSWRYGLLCVLMAVMCSQLKVPGIVLAAILLAAFFRSWLNPSHKWELIAALVLVVVIALLVLFGVELNVPWLGRLVISADAIEIPRIGQFELAFHPVWKPFAISMFVMINWNIAWYLLLSLTLAAIFRGAPFRQASPEALAILGALLFVALAFFITRHHTAAENFVTLNRALLYLVPALVFYVFAQVQGSRIQGSSHSASAG